VVLGGSLVSGEMIVVEEDHELSRHGAELRLHIFASIFPFYMVQSTYDPGIRQRVSRGPLRTGGSCTDGGPMGAGGFCSGEVLSRLFAPGTRDLAWRLTTPSLCARIG
jgi:hypothetical protein